MTYSNPAKRLVVTLLLLALSCKAPTALQESATLSSLEQIDDYPLYTMHYYGAYETAWTPNGIAEQSTNPTPAVLSPAWACSLFSALADADNRLYGRSFDWEFSPALLLFTDPPDGYASVSMVDIAYLGFAGEKAHGLTDLPLAKRKTLLEAPNWPFDGFNEHGLAVGMAAVPSGDMRLDPEKASISSLGVIREILDHARDVDEAVALLRSYNIAMAGGPPLHYLVADASGEAALVEFFRGEMIVTYNQAPWHLATNFIRASVGDSADERCWRYDTLHQHLTDTQGHLTPQGAIDLLADVAQGNTQWSIVYSMSTGDIHVAMGRQFNAVHMLHLDLASK